MTTSQPITDKPMKVCESRYVNPVIAAKCELPEGHEQPHVDFQWGSMGLAWLTRDDGTPRAAWKAER